MFIQTNIHGIVLLTTAVHRPTTSTPFHVHVILFMFSNAQLTYLTGYFYVKFYKHCLFIFPYEI